MSERLDSCFRVKCLSALLCIALFLLSACSGAPEAEKPGTSGLAQLVSRPQDQGTDAKKDDAKKDDAKKDDAKKDDAKKDDAKKDDAKKDDAKKDDAKKDDAKKDDVKKDDAKKDDAKKDENDILGDHLQHDPLPGELNLYDDMANDVQISKASALQKRNLLQEILFLKTLFENRAHFLATAANYPWSLQCWFIGNPGLPGAYGAFHAELVKESPTHDPKRDVLTMRERLNYIHGVWTKTYLRAKRDNQLPLFYAKAFGYGLCVDARTEGLVNQFINPLVNTNYDLSSGCFSNQEYFLRLIQRAQSDANWTGAQFDEAYLRASLAKKLGTQFLGKAIDQTFVDNAVQYADLLGMI